MKVLKFGGSSVGSADAIRQVVEIISREKQGSQCAVVLSAMQGTTDELIETGRAAERGDDGYIEKLSNIGERHVKTISELFRNDDAASISDFVESTIKELENLC